MNQYKKEKIVHTTFRILMSLIFILAGLKHVLAGGDIIAKLAAAPLAKYLIMVLPLSYHVFLAGIALLVGGLGLLLGSWTRSSAILLLAMLIPISVTVQLEGKETMGPLFKNIAIAGGLIYFSYFGTGGWSLDKFKNGKYKNYFALVKIVLAVSLLLVYFFRVSV